MAFSPAEMILGRLQRLNKDEREHQKMYGFLKDLDYGLIDGEPSFAGKVLYEQAKARESSAKLLYDLVCADSATTSSASAASHSRRPRAEVISSGWWAWLERLERDLMDQKMFLACTRRDQVHKQPMKERYLAAWRLQELRRQLRGMEALKLVVKFKADEHAHTRGLQLDCLERITGRSFPRELLIQVVEATLELQIPYWRVDQSTSLATVASKAIRKWPESFGSNSQRMVQEISANAVLKHSLIIIPAIFTSQFTLVTPPEVQGSEDRIRYLALDLRTTPHDGVHNRELRRCAEGMTSLKSLFPNLQSCVVLMHLAHNTGSEPRLPIATDTLGRPTFVRSTLKCRNFKTFSTIITLEETFVNFISTFLRNGPGKRKYVRFIHGSRQNPSLKRIGPLVDMSVQKPIRSLLSMEQLTLEEDRFALEAKRIFQEAYWGKGGPLGDWNKNFREG